MIEHLLMVATGSMLVLLGINMVVWATIFLMSTHKCKSHKR